MQIFSRENIGEDTSHQCVATIGFFDGVHRGHRFLLEKVKDEAMNRGFKSMVITFPQSPSAVLNPANDVPLLNTAEEKIELLHRAGIDMVALLPFTTDLAKLTAGEFMESVLKPQNVKVLLMGYDHRFGHRENERESDYVAIGRNAGIDVIRYKPLVSNDGDGQSTVSSSFIRQSLLQGDVHTASQALGYPYSLEGSVVDGHHVGTSIGYPTANIQVDECKLVPANGVYAVDVRTPDGSVRKGMLNIGRRPTLDNGSERSVEVNIFDFSGNIYGQRLRVEFKNFVRRERKFDSLDDLKRQLASDRQACMC